jgi:hypothetical protein
MPLIVCISSLKRDLPKFVSYSSKQKNGAMKLNFKPGDLSKAKEWDRFVNTLESRSAEANDFEVDMEFLTEIDLAHFNAMIMLYVKMRRLNKRLTYSNVKSATLKNLVSKTLFNHVFSN